MKPNTSLMRQAMIHNKGIEQGATDKLKSIYDWLGITAQVLDDMAEIEQMGEQQRG